MFAIARRMMIFVLLALGLVRVASADEPADKHDDAAARQEVKSDDSAGASHGRLADRPDGWRYLKHNGRWWFWTVDNRWLVWNGTQWTAHQPATVNRAPANDSWRWGWDPANPFDRYPPGRPINSPRMFPKNM